MVTENLNGVKLPPVEQVGIVVRDIDKAIEFGKRVAAKILGK